MENTASVSLRIVPHIQRAATDLCAAHILAPGAYARIPIVDRINQVKVPVTFLCEHIPPRHLVPKLIGLS